MVGHGTVRGEVGMENGGDISPSDVSPGIDGEEERQGREAEASTSIGRLWRRRGGRCRHMGSTQEVARSIDSGKEGVKPFGDDEATEDRVLGMRPIDGIRWLWSPIAGSG